MKRTLAIALCLLTSLVGFAQVGNRVIDSLQEVMKGQEGRDKVLTMIELTWEFYDVSYDDCLDWGERAIKEAQAIGAPDLEADATYALGMQYGYHGDLDLAQEKLKDAFVLHETVGNDARAFEDLWNQARFEQNNGNIDSALLIYIKVLSYAKKRQDSLAMAQTFCNMAVIQHLKCDFAQAEKNLRNGLDIYKSANDTVWMLRTEADIAVVCMDCGKTLEARKLFQDVIPQMEAQGDYVKLLGVYENYGRLLVKDIHDFDSARYYYGKAYSIGELLEDNGIKVPVSNKVNVLVEIGNLDYNQGDYKSAKARYEEAFVLAESNSIVVGEMRACIGLGTVYSCLSMPSEAMRYMDLFFELEKKSGITIARSSIRFLLMLNYARLGQFDKLESELSDLEEEYNGILLENEDIYSQFQDLQNEIGGLLNEKDFQNSQIETLTSQRNHYRLAFFGLLAIVISVVVCLVAYKIVRKKRPK